MTRPTYTARRREALLVFRSADGALEIGKGRITIAPGTGAFFRRAVADLGQVLDAPGGTEAFEEGDALGHPVTIMQPDVPTVPPNAWTLPDDIVAATAVGLPTGQTNERGEMLTGTGAGCGSRIVYDPDDWPRHGDPASPSRHEVLLRMLRQADGYAAGMGAVPVTPGGPGAAPHHLRLACRPAKVGNVLSFPYIVENPGPVDVYVMEAMTGVDPATRAACASDRTAVLIVGGDAIVGRFVPPLPHDRHIAVPVVPLARRLATGGVLEHRLELSPPYVETSPWLPDLPLQQHGAADIRGVVLTIGCWPAGMDGLVATEAAYAPGLYAITAAGNGSRVLQRFPTNGLQFFRRTDVFPRSLD